MTRLELLSLLVSRARTNGFEFRRWYTHALGVPWISFEAALVLLETQRRYYALIFSQDFAKTFWKPGTKISFDVPTQVFQRTMPDGSTRLVQRKSFVRRTARPNAWRYHLTQMALAEEPLRYLRKYLHIEESADSENDIPACSRTSSGSPVREGPKLAGMRPTPTEAPGFLQRPYQPAKRL